MPSNSHKGNAVVTNVFLANHFPQSLVEHFPRQWFLHPMNQLMPRNRHTRTLLLGSLACVLRVAILLIQIWSLSSFRNADMIVSVMSVRSRGDRQYDRWWEITIGTVHRIIFWFVVGSGALTMTIILWMVSIPLGAWDIYQGQKSGDFRKEKVRKPVPWTKSIDSRELAHARDEILLLLLHSNYAALFFSQACSFRCRMTFVIIIPIRMAL